MKQKEAMDAVVPLRPPRFLQSTGTTTPRPTGCSSSMVIAPASRLLPGLLAACVAATAARASGFTDEGQTQLAANHQHGPIALTADGRWLAHVDAANTLHRTAVADRAQGGDVAFD